jgi:hypothetical protein
MTAREKILRYEASRLRQQAEDLFRQALRLEDEADRDRAEAVQMSPEPQRTPVDPRKSIVVSWDDHEQPKWFDIQESLRMYDDPIITSVEHTGDDQCAVIISQRHFSQEEATARYAIDKGRTHG